MFNAYAQSGYVIVDEPHEGTASPSRRTSRIAPVRPPANPVGFLMFLVLIVSPRIGNSGLLSLPLL